MAALSRRDIEMIFRAETDKATRPIAELGKSVKAARGQLEDLVNAATVTEGSLDKLGDTTRDLKKAQDELGSARSLLTSLNTQIGALEKAEAKVESTGAKYRELAERVAGAEKPTKTLTNSMNAAERAFNAAQERLGQVAAEAAQTREQIEGIIGPVANVDTSFREIANTSKEIARGLAVAGAAADSFKTKLANAATAQTALDGDRQFNQQGLDAGLLQAQIDYISQFENRVELLAQAKRELTAQNAAFDQALTAQQAKVGAANVDQLRSSITQTFMEAERAAQVQGFRQIAADASAAVNDVSRFGVAEDATAASTTRLAVAMRDILDPGRAVKSTMDGIESSVTTAATVLEGKGRKSLNEYNIALNELIASGAGIGRIAQQIDAFKDQEAAVEASTRAFKAAQAEALKLAADLGTVDNPTNEMAAALKKAEANVTTAGNEMQREAAKAGEMGRALKLAGVDVNNLAAAETRLAAAARSAAAAQTGIQGATSGKTKGFLGLNVQDATNLSYQINDIFTQLASGQSIFITLAQQGPQIFQIPGVQAFIGNLGTLLPLIGLAVVAIGGLAYAISQANKQAVELSTATGYIAALGEQGSLSARQIANTSLEMQNLGVKAADARKLLADFNEGGLDPKYLDSFTEAARNAAELTGVEFKDAFGALTAAMNGGYEEINKLLDQFPVLTDAERTHIKAMFDSGQESEARRIVFEKFYEKMGEGAAQMRGPWSDAVRSFQTNFKNFFDYLSNVGIAVVNTFKSNMADALNGLNYLILRARGFQAEQARLMVVNGQKPAPLPQGGKGPAGGRATGTSREGQEALAQAREEANLAKGTNKTLRDKARLEKAARDARRNAPKEATDVERAELASLAVAKERVNINAENAKIGARAAKSAQSARNKAENAAEALANKIDGQAEQLESALDAMGGKVAKLAAGTLQDQLAGAATAVEKQYAATLRKLDDFSKLTGGKGKIGGRSIADYRAEVQQNEVILTNQAKLKVYEDNINDVLTTRKQLLADIEDKANRGEITSAEAIRQTQEVTSKYQPLIASLVTAATAFAREIGGANPSAELQAAIAKLEGIGSRTSGDTQADNRKEALARIGSEESKLNQIIGQRNALVESYNTLQQLGLLTADAARKKSADAYNASKAAIAEQSAQLRATLDAARGSIDPQVYDTLLAKLQAIGAQAEYLDPRFAQLKQGIDNIVSQNAVNAIESIAQSFANALAGTESWGDALRDAGLAIVNFIGQTILMIGKLLLQMLVLAAVQAATGIPVAALLGAMNGGGGGGAAGGGGFSLFGLKLFHGGGKVGDSLGGQQRTSRSISVSPATLALAPRYHDGTPGVGLKPQEQIAVLEKGEKVLTEEQQRREAASKAAAPGKRGLRQVLAFGDDQVAAAMAGPAGEDVTVTHLRRNAPLLKQLVGD